MNDLYINGDLSGYLASSVDTTQTSISLYTTNSAWLAVGAGASGWSLDCRIDDEYVQVTAVTGTIPNLTLTVTRGYAGPITVSGSSHNQGTKLYHTLTRFSIDRLYKQAVNGTVVSASRTINFVPHGFNITANTDPSNGVTHLHMQMPLNNEYGIMHTPNVNGWAQFVQADSAALAQIDYSYNGISMTQVAATSATHRVQALIRTLSTTDNYGKFKLLASGSASSTAKFGIFLRQSSTGNMLCFGHQMGQTAIQVWKYSDSNTLTTAYGTIADPQIHHNRMFLGLRIDFTTGATPRYILGGSPPGPSYSSDNYSYYALVVSSSPYSSFFSGAAIDQYGIWMDTPSGQSCSLRCVSMV